MTTPPAAITASVPNAWKNPVLICEATTNSKTSRPKIAPSGSIRIASQRRMPETGAFGLTVLSNGMMTVGPLTVTMAPNRAARYKSQPSIRCAANPAASQVMSTPSVTSLRTTAP